MVDLIRTSSFATMSYEVARRDLESSSYNAEDVAGFYERLSDHVARLLDLDESEHFITL